MASEDRLKPSSSYDDIPMQNITFEEDEYGYVDTKDKKISKELIKQLPSRHIDLIDSGSKLDAISDSNLRRRESKYRTIKLKNATLTSHQVSGDVDKIYELLNSDPNATEEDKIKTLREMHQSLTIKRQVKQMLDVDMKKRRVDQVLDQFTRLKLRSHWVWTKFLYELKNMTYSLELWHSSIKVIQGQLGSGVASYFIFLRWLFYLNLSNFLLVLFFLFIPQALYGMSYTQYSNSTFAAFSGFDLLTGSGWLSDSSLYFGGYTEHVIEVIPGLKYSMPLAYLFVIGIISIINLIVVSYSLTSSYQKNYVDTAGDVKHQFCNKIFAAWDYSIETEDAAKLRKIAFCNEIKELLTFIRKEHKKKTFSEKIVQFGLMILINICCLGITVAVSYLIYYLLEKKALKVQVRIFEDMTLALFVTFVSTAFYFVLKYCTKLEFYLTRKTKLYLTMIRTVLLRTVMIGIIVYFWMISKPPADLKTSCSETELAKEIYRLVLVNFFMTVLVFTLFGEFIRKLLYTYVFSRIKLSRFDVGFNTLDLIYYQTLIWMSTFCMPLAPLINVIILVLLFYLKSNSVPSNCRPPRRTWSVNEAQTFFLTLLFFMFLLSSLAVGYILFVLPPSSCGPFKGYSNTADLIHNLLFKKGEEHKASEIIKYLTSPGVMFAFFCALCVVLYYVRAQAKAHISVVKIIREQLIMEGKDKVFLLKLFDEAIAKHSSKTVKDTENKDTSSRDIPNQDADQDVFINEGYNDYYNASFIPPLPRNFEPGYILANVPINKQSHVSEVGNTCNSPRVANIKIQSPASSVGDCESPLRKPKGIHIPSHQPGFRHFLHEDSPRVNKSAKDIYDKKL